MITLKDLIERTKRRMDEWKHDDLGDTGLLGSVTATLITMMERLDAMEQPPMVAWTGDVGSGRITSIGGQVVADIERAAMIKALVWWCSDCKSGGAGGCEYCKMRDALTRLKNGGEL